MATTFSTTNPSINKLAFLNAKWRQALKTANRARPPSNVERLDLITDRAASLLLKTRAENAADIARKLAVMEKYLRMGSCHAFTLLALEQIRFDLRSM